LGSSTLCLVVGRIGSMSVGVGVSQ
jgi:hypothetical protein